MTEQDIADCKILGGHLDCAGPAWKSCLGVMLRRCNQGGQLLLRHCVEYLQRIEIKQQGMKIRATQNHWLIGKEL